MNPDSILGSSFGGVKVIESAHMVKTRPHILFSERTLAGVAGGKWWLKTEQVPDPDILQMNGMLIGHPATIARLKAMLRDRDRGYA